MNILNTTICLYSDTGEGKSFLLGEYAIYLHLLSEKKKRSIVYLSDKGGWKTIEPAIALGAIQIVPHEGNIFDWTNHIVKGEVPDGKGKWTKPNPAEIAMYAYEGATSIAEEMDLAIRNSHEGPGAGIGSAVSKSKVTATDTSVHLDKSHFGLMQTEVRDAIWQSQELPGIVLWTFRARRVEASDTDTRSPILGPQVAGKAMTPDLPAWFHYTFRVGCVVAAGQPERHILYFGGHVDPTTGLAKGMGNVRTPLGAEPMPQSIEPASLVKAMQEIQKRASVKVDEAAFKAKYGIK